MLEGAFRSFGAEMARQKLARPKYEEMSDLETPASRIPIEVHAALFCQQSAKDDDTILTYGCRTIVSRRFTRSNLVATIRKSLRWRIGSTGL